VTVEDVTTQENLIGEVKPDAGVTVIVAVPVDPFVTANVEELAASV
jgi:hypothetical protein